MKWRDSGNKYPSRARSAEWREERLPARAYSAPIAVALGLLLVIESAAFAAKRQQNTALPQENGADRGLFLEVRLPKQLKLAALKQGDLVDGTLAQSVYAGAQEMLPAGARVRLTVSGIERRRTERSVYWPWIVRKFAPAHTTVPVFESARVSLAGHAAIPLRVRLIAWGRNVEVHPAVQRKSHRGTAAARQHRTVLTAGGRELTLLLRASAAAPGGIPVPAKPAIPVSAATLGPVILKPGTKAHVMLLRSLSASKSRKGEALYALLLDPVRSRSAVALPEGTVFEGQVERCVPPRWLSRPGSIHIAFTRLVLPKGEERSIEASLAGVEMDRTARARMDNEGALMGGRPGAAWTLINLGMAAGIAKESDDALQLIIEAAVSTATDASTAGTTRIVAAVTFGVFVVTRRGRDVVLPEYTEMDLTFTQPVALTGWSDAILVRDDPAGAPSAAATAH
ncbi:MAG TPA: hypothetical protein VGY31_01910 [Terriglobia bacterium]|nr:hypothetical protein [Terriglobia bacterium]